MVVFFRFRSEGDALAEALSCEQINGDTPARKRQDLVDQFQANEIPVLLAQIQAGSTAITLTNASHMVYHSLSYSYEDWAQSQDRIHRIGQHDPCFYYYMVAEGNKGGITVDKMVLNILQAKKDVASMVTNNPDLLLFEETA